MRRLEGAGLVLLVAAVAVSSPLRPQTSGRSLGGWVGGATDRFEERLPASPNSGSAAR